MPRIPDLDSLGARPVPQSRTALTRNPTAGLVGDALSGVGDKLARIGEQQFDKEDRLAYASAKAMVANADIAARTELANDPDFDTANERYTARMKEVRGQASGLIQSRFDRQAFELDSETDIARGSAQVSAMVQDKRTDKGRADLVTAMDGLSKSALDAPDDASRQNIFSTVTEMISGAKENGYVTAEEAGRMARDFAANDAGNRIERALADDEVDKAARILGDAKDALPTNRYTDYHQMIQGKMTARETYGDASAIMGGGWSDEQGSPVNYADPLRGRGQGVTDAFGAARGNGKSHNGVDFAAARGTPIQPIAAGKVIQVGKDDRSGNFVIVDHGNGTTSSYSHMDGQSPLKAGDLITPDTQLGKVGSTGHSSGPHLHLVVKQDGKTIDPQKVIGAAQQGPKRHNLDTLLAQTDAAADQQGWSFERRERAKDEIRRRVSVDEGLKAREEDAADRTAQEYILGKREAFTDPNSIPRPVWEKMSVSARQAAMNAAENNRKPKEPPANSMAIMQAHAIMYSDPERFKSMDLTQYVGRVTRAELDGLISEQARSRNPANAKDENSPRSAVSSAINWHTKLDPELDKALDPAKNPEAYARVAGDMEAYLRSVTGGKRAPTDAETDAAFKRATMKVIVQDAGWFGGSEEKRRFELEGGEVYHVDIPDNVRSRIVASVQKNFGRVPDETEIARLYVQQKGKPGFWQ